MARLWKLPHDRETALTRRPQTSERCQRNRCTAASATRTSCRMTDLSREPDARQARAHASAGTRRRCPASRRSCLPAAASHTCDRVSASAHTKRAGADRLRRSHRVSAAAEELKLPTFTGTIQSGDRGRSQRATESQAGGGRRWRAIRQAQPLPVNFAPECQRTARQAPGRCRARTMPRMSAACPLCA